jgi:integrase
MRDVPFPRRISISKRALDKLRRPSRDMVLWDSKLAGFGVRLSPDGRVSFVTQYRNSQGRSRRITIGAYGTFTPDQARKQAERLLGEARAARFGWVDSVDPAERRRQERHAITFKQLAAEYLEKSKAGLIIVKGKAKKAGTVQTDGYRMKHLTAFFGDKAVKGITLGDCQRCLESLIAGKHGAARTFGLLGAVFTYGVRQGHIAASPAVGVGRPADGKRDFRLEADDYRVLGKLLAAAESCREDWRAVAAIRLIALTGARKSEVLKLRLSEVDLEGRCLRLGDTKTGASVRVLGGAAIEVLRAVINRGGRPQSPYVFPGRDPRKPFSGLGKRRDGAWSRIVGDAYTPHSLRHAFASIGHDLGIGELTIAYLLGHVSARSGSVTRGYIRPDGVLLEAADTISGHIWVAMTGTEPTSL